MMPEEWASMRSMARCVLPVLVGPRTAVTPAPRARESRATGEEKEMGISCPEGGAGRVLRTAIRPFCTTMRRVMGFGLSSRTSLERIAAESVTLRVYDFVHGDMSRHLFEAPPYRVSRLTGAGPFLQTSVNGTRAPGWQGSLRLEVGCGRHRLMRNGDKLGRLQDPKADRRRYRRSVGHHQPGTSDRGKPHLHVALLDQIFDGGTLRDVPGDRHEVDRAHHHGTLVAFFRLDLVQALEDELQVVAHAAVEHRQRPLAGLRHER